MHCETTLTAGFFLLALGLSGCGSSAEQPYPVSGRVTFQGKPVWVGVMRFSNPQAAVDMTADLNPDGSYEVVRVSGKGLPVGTYQVAVLPPRRDRPMGLIEKPAKLPPVPDIPAKYHQPSTSGLSLTVKPGVNVFDVELQP